MAVTNKNVIDFSIVKKALNGEKFLKFIKKLKRKDKENKMSYLMDNCVIHRTNKLKEYVKKEKMHLIVIVMLRDVLQKYIYLNRSDTGLFRAGLLCNRLRYFCQSN